MSGYDAVILAGGKAKRLGGIDKPGLDMAGVPMLDRVLTACAGARGVVVVGAERPTVRPVAWTVEDPPQGGPLAGLGAGVAALPDDVERLVVLAADMPFIDAGDIDRLLARLPGYEAAVFTDDEGIAQPLAAAYVATALRASLRACGDLRGRPMMRILDGIRFVLVADHGVTRDCDTVDQVEAARMKLRRT